MCEKNQFIQCRNCPCIKNPGPQKGYYLDTIDGVEVVRECACHIKWRKEQELIYTCYQSRVSINSTFNSYKGTISLGDLNALKQIANKPDKFLKQYNYYLYGNKGTQKTTMAKVLGKELIKKGYSVQYTIMSELLEKVVKTFNEEKEDENRSVIKHLLDVDFLIIDDSFDKNEASIAVTGYQLPYLISFMKKRYEILRKPTLYISEVLPWEIETRGFGEAIQDFITRTTNNSRLEFRDVYNDSAVGNRLGLFD